MGHAMGCVLLGARRYMAAVRCGGEVQLDYEMVMLNPGGFWEQQYGFDQQGTLPWLLMLR